MDIQNPEKKLYCINCGKRGHNSKRCLCPIISIGIICVNLKIDNLDINSIISYTKKIQNKYTLSSDEILKINELKQKVNEIQMDNIEYLMICRKHSLNYVELIRGKIDINNLDYLEKCFNFITNYEKELILNNDFDFLWENLWGNNFKNLEYIESNEKFKLLKNGIYIKNNDIDIYTDFNRLINGTILNFKDPEWGFPKGRRNNKEKNIECAKREFEEETGLSHDLYNILNYLSQIKNINSEIKINKMNDIQQIEVGDIKWLNFEESLSFIRDYNIEKKYILINLHNSLKNIIENFKMISKIYQ